jgi:cytochrome c553
MTPTLLRTLPLAVLPLSFGCWGQEQHDEVAENDVVEEMAAHHVQAVTMRDAVVAGDLDAVRAAAQDLRSRLPVGTMPDDAKYDELLLRDAIAKAVSARDVDAAAQATAEMTVACGSCHAARGVSFHQPVPPRPVDGEGVQAEMARHHWAATRMWQGLLLPDKGAFEEAAAVMGASDLAPSGTAVDSPLPAATVELEVRVHDLVAQAARTEEPARRGAAYAALLATCASCHAVTSKGPGQPPAPAPPEEGSPEPE